MGSVERLIATAFACGIFLYAYVKFVRVALANKKLQFSLGDVVWASVVFAMFCVFGHALDGIAAVGLWPWTVVALNRFVPAGRDSERLQRFVFVTWVGYTFVCIISVSVYWGIFGSLAFNGVRDPLIGFTIVPIVVLGMPIQKTMGPNILHPLSFVLGTAVSLVFAAIVGRSAHTC